MQLRPYQEIGRDFLASRTRALLADEMRVGKTPQAILAAHKAGAQSVLVVCPAIGVPQWKRELERWWPSGPLPRSQVWSYDKARSEWERGLRGKVDVFIPDECHFAKNPEAARTKMVYGKDGFARLAGAIWPLSGTPAPKHAGELWTMLKAFGATEMGYEAFLQRYCRLNFEGKAVGTKEDMIPELRAILAKVMLRRKRKEVAPEMPDISYEFLNVEPVFDPRGSIMAPILPPDGDLLQWLEEHAASEQQFRIAVASAKVPALVENIAFAIENDLLTQTVVFGYHVAPLLAVCEALRARGISAEVLNGQTSDKDRVRIQDDFRAGRLQVVVANIITAGTAIDLSAASHGYMLELAWTPGTNAQAANRLISMDKSNPVTIDVCSWAGSTDDRIQKVLLTRAAELAKMY